MNAAILRAAAEVVFIDALPVLQYDHARNIGIVRGNGALHRGDFLLLHSAFLLIHASKNFICYSVWNQCSPPGMTVSSAPFLFAKDDMVSMEVRSSCSPYRMRVGTCHMTGCSRT